MSPQVSVIIPIYNEEERLRRCVDSVVAQTYSNLEIILIDDGSTDRSLDICRQYTKEDPRIFVISQPNQGLSAARNAGIAAASSSFLQFVDSDDYLFPTMTESLMAALLEEDASASQCSFYIIQDGLSFPCPEKFATAPPHTTYRGREVPLLLERDYLRTVVQVNKLFRRDIFRDLRYPLGKYHEDEFVIHRELAAMTAITCIDVKLYCYVRHSGSITDKKTAKRSIHICEALLDRFSYYANNHEFDLAGRAYLRLLQRIKGEMDYLKNESDNKEFIDQLLLIRANASRISNTCLSWKALN